MENYLISAEVNRKSVMGIYFYIHISRSFSSERWSELFIHCLSVLELQTLTVNQMHITHRNSITGGYGHIVVCLICISVTITICSSIE